MTYIVSVKLNMDVPELIPISGRRIQISYPGVQTLCTKCFGKFNLVNTFYDLFRHICMSPIHRDSHMKPKRKVLKTVGPLLPFTSHFNIYFYKSISVYFFAEWLCYLFKFSVCLCVFFCLLITLTETNTLHNFIFLNQSTSRCQKSSKHGWDSPS